MMPPEPIDGPAPRPTPAPLQSGRSASPSLRTELLHRHLVARVAAAREQVRCLEQPTQAPEALVARFGATVVEAQRALAAERLEADRRATVFGRVAEDRGAQLLAEAEAEARILRAAATWLRQVVAAGAVPTATETAVAVPVLAPVEARAS
jgi:hypothetical protein